MTEEGKSIINQEVSKEIEVDVKFVNGKIRIGGNYDGKGLDVGVYIQADPEYFLRKLAKAIPGQVDDSIIEMLIMASKVVK